MLQLTQMGKRHERTAHKEETQMGESAHDKMLPVSRPQGRATPQTTTTRAARRSRPGTLMSNAAEDVEQQELSFAVGGNAAQGSHFGSCSGSFAHS